MANGALNDGGQQASGRSKTVDGKGERQPAGTRWKFEVAWLGIVGIILYVALRYPYATYYQALGSSPEEVGLDYVNLLARSSALIFIVLLSSTVFALVPVLAAFYTSYFRAAIPFLRVILDPKAWRRIPGTKSPNPMMVSPLVVRAWKETRHLIPFIAVPVILILLALFLPQVASSAATSVRACQRPQSVWGFGLMADPVHIYDGGDLAPRYPDKELRLLGANSSTYIVYDCKMKETLRIPIDSVVVIRGE